MTSNLLVDAIPAILGGIAVLTATRSGARAISWIESAISWIGSAISWWIGGMLHRSPPIPPDDSRDTSHITGKGVTGSATGVRQPMGRAPATGMGQAMGDATGVGYDGSGNPREEREAAD